MLHANENVYSIVYEINFFSDIQSFVLLLFLVSNITMFMFLKIL